MWQVVLFVNLTLGLGLGLGYAEWGRRIDRLARELEATRARVAELERERQACAAGARTGEQQWQGRGVVRAIFPDADLLVITHEEIRDLLPARTTSFRTASPTIRAAVRPGDAIRFSLQGTPPDATIVAITRW